MYRKGKSSVLKFFIYLSVKCFVNSIPSIGVVKNFTECVLIFSQIIKAHLIGLKSVYFKKTHVTSMVFGINKNNNFTPNVNVQSISLPEDVHVIEITIYNQHKLKITITMKMVL